MTVVALEESEPDELRLEPEEEPLVPAEIVKRPLPELNRPASEPVAGTTACG